MEVLGVTLPSYGMAIALAATLASVLGVRLFFTWRERRFAEAPHASVRATLALGYVLVYGGMLFMAAYVLAAGRIPYVLMDQVVTVVFGASSLALTATMLLAFGSGTEFTRDQANNAFFLLAVPGAVALGTALWAFLRALLALAGSVR